MANANAVSQDPSLTHLGTMHNFTIYKFRYRWQKRILQIDFLSKTIFNIEKGTMKKQFPFSEVKSVEDHDAMRFNITFHGHQNYELEASSHEDKQRIMQLLSMIILDNEKPCPAPPPVRRPSQVGVLHEGLMELQKRGPNSEKWVKHLVKLREDELVLYCVDHNEGEPAEQVIQLSNGIVSSASHHGYPTFTLQSNGNHYVFRIFVSEHNKAKVDMKKLTDNWVDLLSNYCTHVQSQPEEQSIYSRITDLNSNGPSNHTAEKQFAPGKKKIENQSLFANSPYAAISQVAVLPPAYYPPPVTPKRAVFRGLSPLPPPLPTPYKSPSTRQTKALHWDQIPQEKINKSIWAVSILGNKKIDLPRILDQFSTTGKTTFQGNFSDSVSTQKILLDHKIALNFNIILKGFNIAPSQLKDKLLIIHEKDGGLTNEQITTLRRYAPTLKDIKMYQSYNGSPSELHIVDQFMIEMCNIPNIGRRLDLLLNIRELPVCMKDLYPLILQITKACRQLLTSESFVAVLGYILAIGNCLNENTGKEKAIGFRLSTLNKLPQLWGKEKKFTLLHALVEQILLHEPDLTKFSSELTEFEAVPDASVKGLNAEVDVIRKQLGNIVEYSKLMKNKTPDQEQFYKQLKVIIQNCEEEYAQLSKRCEELKKLYSDVLLKFGEQQDQDSQELFGWISSFLNGFNKAYTEF